jgi:hypothetical protein
MPHPNQFDTPSLPPLLTCPDCFKLMRINQIEAANGREIVQLVCDDCGREATQHIEYER